jgi:hypothetical protein
MLIISILQLKDMDWQVELKNKTQPFVANKKGISLTKMKASLT